jgi:hypothetical protein
MLCSYCGKNFKIYHKDNQEIQHCLNCGASFFEENGINRISLTSALSLPSGSKQPAYIDGIKLCPRDKIPLIIYRNEDAVPREVTLLKCTTCNGILATKNDLIWFKRAQHVKIRFFKLWGKPLPSVQTILVLSFLSVISASLVGSILTSKSTKTQQSQAQDIVEKPAFHYYAHQLYITFTTRTPYTSVITITNTATHEKITKTVSSVPTNIHLISIENWDASAAYMYQITVTSENGTVIKTKEAVMNIQ